MEDRENSTILDLIHRLTLRLETLDLHVLDASLFVYDLEGKVYSNFDELRKDMMNKGVKTFLDVDIIIGPRTWTIV